MKRVQTKAGKKMKAKQEAIVETQKREREDAKAPGLSRSSSPAAQAGTTGKRDLEDTRNDDEAPDKVQKIMSICIGEGAADKRVGISVDAYADDSKKMAEEYRERDSSGECFVHNRKKYSSNRDLRALSGLTKRVTLYKVNLGGKEAESIFTNSAKLANIIEASNCRSTEDVVREMEKEVKGDESER